MEQYYQISLQPLGSYFFGTEMVSELGNRQNYFQRSAAFPQQTTLLGFLRHQLLLSQGMATPAMPNASGNMEDLIGQGFNPSSKNTYGIIKELSPVFLQKNGQGAYFLFGKDRLTVGPDQEEQLAVNPVNGIAWSPLKGIEVPLLQLWSGGKKYVNKHDFIEYLKDVSGDIPNSNIKLETLVSDAGQVGIHKSFNGNSTEQAYFKNVYKQLGAVEAIVDDESSVLKKSKAKFAFKQLVENWRFAFYALLDDANLEFEGERVALLGKEQSPFFVSITKEEDPPSFFLSANPSTTPNDGRLYAITLLSDSFVSEEKELLKHMSLGLIDTVKFRYINNSHQFNRKSKSSLFNLIKRGSVIYTNQPKEVEILLAKEKAFRNIGYNYFTTQPANIKNI